MRSLVATIVGVGLVLAWCHAAPAITPEEEEMGFVSIFDGKTLKGWDGDERLWSVKDGVIRGETTKENPAHGNTFCVWRDGKLRDFILKIQFRIQNGNSGIQYRSKEVSKWVISGYQAEVQNAPGKVGFLYHEKGRGWLVNVGDFMVIDEEGKKNVVSKVADVKALKEKGYYKDKDWNEYIIIAQGNYLRHYLNGYPTMALIDNDKPTDPADPKDRKGSIREGLLALQIHAGAPMVVEFKDIRIKHLTSKYGRAVRLFNGENLDGWTVPFENMQQANTFTVKDGILDDTGRPAGYIRTTDDFTNYTLHLQLQHVQK
ncbi:MAG: family 16 glycoside hydrolase, partial [Planctomycetota bacterium]|nr:family 16 glycoside hydrolase [Planctomycetota bacterium]